MGKERKGSALIVGLVAIIFVIGVALFWYVAGRRSLQSAISSPPSAIIWNTYTSGMYGYTIQYPIGWIVTSTVEGSGEQFEITNIYDPNDSESGIVIDDVETCSTNQSLLDCANEYMGIYQLPQWSHTSFVTTTINTYPAVSTDLSAIFNGQSQISRCIFFRKNLNLFKITFLLDQPAGDINIINQMLSTFSFH